MRLLAPVAVAVSLLGSVAFAQSQCDAEACSYDFSAAAEGFWPDWLEISPLDVNWLEVKDGKGYVNVLSDGPDFFQQNHAHLLWTAVGHGYPAAEAIVRFTGDNGRTGWIEKFADGRIRGPRDCHSLEHAPRMSDEVLILTLYDDGETFVGAFLGDLLPLGMNLTPRTMPDASGFAVMGIVQMLPGDSQPRVLDYTQGPAIAMFGDDLRLTLRVDQEADGWHASASARKVGGDVVYMSKARVAEPNIRGGIGLGAVNGARPFCIYQDGGEINRQYEVGMVKGWYE